MDAPILHFAEVYKTARNSPPLQLAAVASTSLSYLIRQVAEVNNAAVTSVWTTDAQNFNSITSVGVKLRTHTGR